VEVKVDLALGKKQQAPLSTDDSISLLYKPHFDVSESALKQLQSQQLSGSFPFPTDGLVFTPKAMPYALGMQQLLFKWQPPQQTGADLTGRQLQQESLRRSGINLVFEHAAGLEYDAASKAVTAVRNSLQKLPAGLVYECVMLTEAHVSKTSSTSSSTHAPATNSSRRRQNQVPDKIVWLPQSVRWDKAVGNDPNVLAAIERRLLRPAVSCISYDQLLQAARQVQECVVVPPPLNANSAPEASVPSVNQSDRPAPAPSSSSTSAASDAAHVSSCCSSAVAATTTGTSTPAAAAGPDSSSSSGDGSGSGSSRQHPARSMPFDELYAAVQAAVAAGKVECTCDEASGLEVYCYNMSEPPRSLTAALCRGLVLHPDSKAVVATPFVRFDDLKQEQVGLQQKVGSC
jgi:hypothetical protein